MPRVSNENDEAPKRAPRRRVAKPKSVSASAEAPVAAPRRKSPSTLPTANTSLASRSKRGTKKYVALGVMISGLALAAFVGYSDKGQIDIASVISERNAKLTAGVSGSEGGDSASVIVPVQNTSNLPNGGLVGSTEPQVIPPPPVLETATTTGTSTASSSDEVLPPEEGSETTTEEEELVDPAIETTPTEVTPL